MDYQIMSCSQFKKMINDTSKKQYEPIGKFIVQDVDCFIAVENSTGEAFTEEFASKRSAIMWLHGYATLNRFKMISKAGCRYGTVSSESLQKNE